MASSNGNIFRVTGHLCGEFTGHRPVTRRFGVFFDLHLNKRLSKQWWGWWFETPSRPLWRHCNVLTLGLTEDHWHAVKTNCYSMTIKLSAWWCANCLTWGGYSSLKENTSKKINGVHDTKCTHGFIALCFVLFCFDCTSVHIGFHLTFTSRTLGKPFEYCTGIGSIVRLR